MGVGGGVGVGSSVIVVVVVGGGSGEFFSLNTKLCKKKQNSPFWR